VKFELAHSKEITHHSQCYIPVHVGEIVEELGQLLKGTGNVRAGAYREVKLTTNGGSVWQF